MFSPFYSVIIYVAILFILSAFFVKKALASFEEYSYCGKSLSITFVIFTYFGTWVGGGTIIGLTGRSYAFGASQYWVMALSCIAEFFFAVFFISKIRHAQYKSITEFFAAKFSDFGGIIRLPVSAGLLLRNVTMVAMQFSALSYLITFVFEINRNLALLLIFLVIVLYTVLSGLWGVAFTDVFQGILQTGCLIGLIVTSLKTAGGVEHVTNYYVSHDNISNMNLFFTNLHWYELVLYVMAFGLFFMMNDQTSWERIYASRGDKTAKWGFMIPLAVTMISLVLVTYLGVFQKAIYGTMHESASVLYHFIFDIQDLKVLTIILIGLIASIMSSADSFLLASGVMVSEDIIKKFVIKDASDTEMIFFTRIFVVVTGSVAFAFALNIDDILNLWLSGIGMTSIMLVPGYFFGWFAKQRNTKSILAGMAVGIAYVICMLTGFIAINPMTICIGMFLNFLAIVFSMSFYNHLFKKCPYAQRD